MARTLSASNAVVAAVEEAAALYRVPAYRMNSRTFMVEGAGGRMRPMFMGRWKDRFGVEYRKGMSDLLLMPMIEAPFEAYSTAGNERKVFMPLWVECKSGSGRLTPEQKAFAEDVTATGQSFLLVRDSAESLLTWFKDHGVGI